MCFNRNCNFQMQFWSLSFFHLTLFYSFYFSRTIIVIVLKFGRPFLQHWMQKLSFRFLHLFWLFSNHAFWLKNDFWNILNINNFLSQDCIKNLREVYWTPLSRLNVQTYMIFMGIYRIFKFVKRTFPLKFILSNTEHQSVLGI